MNVDDSWWGQLSPKDKAEYLLAREWWCTLPPYQRRYIGLKARYAVYHRVVIFLLLLAWIVGGILAIIYEQNPWLFALWLILGLMAGVIAVWEIERRR